MKKNTLRKLAAFVAGLAMIAVTANVAVANEAGLLKCRALADPGKRLACYDAIVVVNAAAGSASSAKMPTGTVPSADTAATPAVTNAAAAAAGSTSRSLGQAAEFGLPPKQTAVGVDRIESTIKGRLEGWQQGSRIRLANGQLWQVTDDSRGVCECDNRKVVVTRGAFGTYFLEIEGKGNAPRVKRIE
ncbi:MAG: hypothetical protein ING73_06720 [Rhodocyclaceae bacterium]|nr:hypothetical protein [Rhodocyclaceae bacterium]MCA3024232.1 hypothetical protein [Rhodocyclaceae bacterium]MCA3030972.1 hypothetical protein [Rhodocyclaceae bacterium]MCA3037276.1 hypothetical protein [Rhodocyclaceae bacterium]MCA3039845.1 hypothetical protein [Rhodocyclaceae bacterium]